MLYYSYSGPLSDQSVQHQFRAMVSREKAQLKSSKGRGVMLSNLSLEAVEAVPEERVWSCLLNILTIMIATNLSIL